MRKRKVNLLLLIALLFGLNAGWLAGPGATQARAQATDDLVEQLIAGMTVEERVGQLFLVTFVGNQVAPPSDIAELIQTYRVGGVVLLTANENTRNQGDTALETAQLIAGLQEIALTAPELVTKYPQILSTQPITPTASEEAGAAPAIETVTHIPLFVAVDHEGDGYPYTRLINGFTQVPNNLAIGATWNDSMAQEIGRIVGTELRAIGVNMLLGPSLDVLDNPRPVSGGDLGSRTFGGDPYWVGRLGEAYIRGVHLGGEGGVVTVAKHFPGFGGSDRRADEEVATVNKSLQELYRIELAPFFVTTKESKIGSPSATDALMTSHIRYRGFQGNIRQLTRPISFDAQNLPALMRLPEFAPWRQAGGLLVSDALGVPAVRRYYDPKLQTFPYRQIAQEAFLAGNDLLLLSQFALNDIWSEQFENIKATATYFQDKYIADEAFRERVDQSLRRILRLKLKLYPEFTLDAVVPPAEALAGIGQGNTVVTQVAKQAATLIYPGVDELADRLPSPPLADEPILIFTDARQATECPNPDLCPPFSLIPVDALQSILLQLYGPDGSGQIAPEMLRSFTFEELRTHLTQLEQSVDGGEASAAEGDLASAIESARWVVFAMLDIETDRHASSDALRQFLRLSEPDLRDKKVVVFAFNEPYYLDTTEISKLTAYYCLYSKTLPFLDVAVRMLFQEIVPPGRSPVNIPSVNYDLITATEPDPDQIIQVLLSPAPAAAGETTTVGISVGGTLRLATSVILDRNGNPVPDGTPVEFRLIYPADSLELPRLQSTTTNGVAGASVVLERTGQLNVTASSGGATRSTTLQVTIQENEPAQIATVEPSPSPTATPTDTPLPTATATDTVEPTATATATATATPTSTPSPTATDEPTTTPTATETARPTPAIPLDGRWGGFTLSMLVLVSAGSLLGLVCSIVGRSAALGVRVALWLFVGGVAGYIISVQGLVSGSITARLPDVWVTPITAMVLGIVVGGVNLLIEPLGRRLRRIEAD